MDYKWLYPLTICRMPLYFLLSGLFFKQYKDFADFLKRKINKLFVPFVFFYITTSIMFPILLKQVGYDVRNASVTGLRSLCAFYSIEVFSNMPIWFLLCLFEINVVFYMLRQCTKQLDNSIFFLVCICAILGAVGIEIGNRRVNLPMFLDTALSALPFFCMGYVLNKYTMFLQPNKYDKYNWIVIIACAVYSMLFSVKVEYSGNNYYGNNAWWIYSCGLSGIMFFLLLSKKIKSLPFVSYWGRYSIIILVTHNLVIQVLLIAVRKLNFMPWPSVMLTLLITMFLYLLIIPFMKKYFPYVVAQKDLIEV